MSVAWITLDKKQAYAADITYGTNNEFGFDYLRDNMAFTADEKVQRELNFAVVDEVDSILIDEARTPLIISGSVSDSTEMHLRFAISLKNSNAANTVKTRKKMKKVIIPSMKNTAQYISPSRAISASKKSWLKKAF